MQFIECKIFVNDDKFYTNTYTSEFAMKSDINKPVIVIDNNDDVDSYIMVPQHQIKKFEVTFDRR